MCPRQAAHPLAPDQWRRLTSLGISRSKPMHSRCRRGLKSDARWLQNRSEWHYKRVLALNFCARKCLREEANLHFAHFFLSNIQADTSFSACNTKNCSIIVVLPRNHPRDSNTPGRKNSNLATLNWTNDYKKTQRIQCWSAPGQHQ